MDRNKIIENYLSKINDKDFDLLDARKEMEKNNIGDEDIKSIIRDLDDEIQRRLVHSSTRDKSWEMIGIGIVLTIVGLIITLGTFTGFLNTGDSFLIVYGPVILGISFIVGGISARRKVRIR